MVCQERSNDELIEDVASVEGPKRARTVVRQERSDDKQVEDLASVLRPLEEEFAEKERLSDGQAWCTLIPLTR